MVCGPTSCIPKSNKWAVLTVCTALSGSSPSHSLKRTRYQQIAVNFSQLHTNKIFIKLLQNSLLWYCLNAAWLALLLISVTLTHVCLKFQKFQHYRNTSQASLSQATISRRERAIHSPAPRRAP